MGSLPQPSASRRSSRIFLLIAVGSLSLLLLVAVPLIVIKLRGGSSEYEEGNLGGTPRTDGSRQSESNDVNLSDNRPGAPRLGGGPSKPEEGNLRGTPRTDGSRQPVSNVVNLPDNLPGASNLPSRSGPSESEEGILEGISRTDLSRQPNSNVVNLSDNRSGAPNLLDKPTLDEHKPEVVPFENLDEIEEELDRFERLETSVTQLSVIIDRYDCSSFDLTFKLRLGDFLDKLADSAELHVLNLLIKDPKLAISADQNLKRNSKLFTRYSFYHLEPENFSLAEKAIKDKTIRSFKQMDVSQKFSADLMIFILSWYNYNRTHPKLKYRGCRNLYKKFVKVRELYKTLSKDRELPSEERPIPELPKELAELLTLGDSDDILIPFLEYITSDLSDDDFLKKLAFYEALALCIETEADFKNPGYLSKLHDSFRELRALMKGDPIALKYYKCEYPVLTQFQLSKLGGLLFSTPFITEPSPANLKSIAEYCLDFRLQDMGVYLGSFYEKDSKEYREYIEAFSLSVVDIIFDKLRKSLGDALLPQKLNLEEPLQSHLLTLSICSAKDPYKIYIFDTFETALKDYYGSLVAASPKDDERIKLIKQNIDDLDVASRFIKFSMELYYKNIDLVCFDTLATFMNFDVLKYFYDTSSSDLDLNSKFLAWLNSMLLKLPEADEKTDPDPLIMEEYKKELDNLSNDLGDYFRFENVEKRERIKKTYEEFKKGLLAYSSDRPFDINIFTTFFDKLSWENNSCVPVLRETCGNFIRLYIAKKSTRPSAILFFLLFNLASIDRTVSGQMNIYFDDRLRDRQFVPLLNFDSAILYLTYSWMQQQNIPSFQSFGFFWRNNVYKIKIMIKLDSDLASIKSKLSKPEELNFKKSLDFKSLSEQEVEFLVKNELHNILEMFWYSCYLPEYFNYIRKEIPEERVFLNLLKDNRSSVKLDSNNALSPAELFKAYEDNSGYLELKHRIGRLGDPGRFDELLSNFISEWEGKLEFPDLEEKLERVLKDLLDQVVSEIIPEYYFLGVFTDISRRSV